MGCIASSDILVEGRSTVISSCSQAVTLKEGRGLLCVFMLPQPSLEAQLHRRNSFQWTPHFTLSLHERGKDYELM
jgi:hypothetical protein